LFLGKKWRATIDNHRLGTYPTRDEAALAYNEFLLRKGRFCGGVRGGWVPVIKRPELDTAG